LDITIGDFDAGRIEIDLFNETPKTSANFYENIMISRIGLVMFKYNPESD
jgi:hypothetical protein